MKKKFLSMLIVSAVAVTAMGCSNNTNESSKSAASSIPMYQSVIVAMNQLVQM